MPKKSMSNAANSKENSQAPKVKQVRGSELGQKMAESQEKGDAYRAANQGRDVVKKPGTSNTKKSHKS